VPFGFSFLLISDGKFKGLSWFVFRAWIKAKVRVLGKAVRG
jgi:hypothetical protein